MSRSKRQFPTMAPSKLIKFFSFAVLSNEPKELCSILMVYNGKSYSVPTEVARIIHHNLGELIDYAQKVNKFKIDNGRNPVPGISINEQ